VLVIVALQNVTYKLEDRQEENGNSGVESFFILAARHSVAESSVGWLQKIKSGLNAWKEFFACAAGARLSPDTSR
jgi:hypothetical protein